MGIFIGYESALEFWRSEHADARPSFSRALPSPKQAPDRKAIDLAALPSFGISGNPIHLVVANAAARSQSKLVTCHTASALPPDGSSLRISSNVLVSSPNLLFLQMARRLPLAELVLLGYELCGSYAPSETEDRGFRTRPPLTSALSIQRFVDKAAPLAGIKAARRALRFVQDNSASPMESIQAMLLCLPRSLGGLGVGQAELNGVIDRTATGKPFPCGAFYRGDMVWRSHNLIVEYDSDLCHSGSEQIARDSKRRAALLAAGYTVVTVTKAQVLDARELEKVANLLIRKMGGKVRRQPYNALSRRYELRKALFASFLAASSRNPDSPTSFAQSVNAPPHEKQSRPNP